ncbi:hypothetical protein HDU98_005948, partial [Podochytrium sp. JEL0797]
MAAPASQPIPTPLKSITSFIQRADELTKRDPIMSYYCNFFAAKQAIELNCKDTESQMYMLGLLDTLEAAKAEIGTLEAIQSEVVGAAHVENFALKVFVA